jgi:hypothetical protein
MLPKSRKRTNPKLPSKSCGAKGGLILWVFLYVIQISSRQKIKHFKMKKCAFDTLATEIIIDEIAASHLSLKDSFSLARTNSTYYDMIWKSRTFFGLYLNMHANKESLVALKGKGPSFEEPAHAMRHLLACHSHTINQRDTGAYTQMHAFLGIAQCDVVHYQKLLRRKLPVFFYIPRAGHFIACNVFGYIQYPHEQITCSYEITITISYQLDGLNLPSEGVARLRFGEASLYKPGMITRITASVYGLGEISIFDKSTGDMVLIRKNIDATDLSLDGKFLLVKGVRIERT